MADPHEALRDALANKYEFQEVLGEGGMGTVFLARDLRHDRRVALKTIHPHLATTNVRDRFEREIQITAQLRHPHILPLHDSGIAGDTLYYVMPYIDGESLKERLDRERQLPIDEALKIATQVADALGHAHSHGVVHRDVKPANILFEAGHAVVTDFGISKAVREGDQEQLTKTGISVGTPHYMSPEQASGTEEVDGRSDLYSLACVLYEMLAGDPPFTASTPMAIIARHMADSVPSLRAVRDTVPEPTVQAIEKALAKSPADRYQTAEGFAEALVKGEEAPVAAARSKRVLRGVAGVVAIAAIVGGAVVAVGIGTGLWQPSPRGGHTGESGVTVLEPRFERLTVSGEASNASISPNGRHVAYLDGERLMVADLQAVESKPQMLLPGVSRFSDLHWSPNGANLYVSAHLSGESGIFRVPSTGGTSRRLTRDPWPFFDFSPDGSRLAATQWPSRHVYIFTLAGPDSLIERPAAVEISGDYQWLTGVAWHPTGDVLLVVTQTAAPVESVLWEVSLESGEQVEIATIEESISLPRWSADGRAIYAVHWALTGYRVLRIHYPSTGVPPEQVLSDCIGTSTSADGQRLVCTRTSKHGSIWRVVSDPPAVSWHTRLTPAADTAWKDRPSVSPNGNWVAYSQQNEGGWDLFKVPARGGDPKRITRLGSAWSPAWSPDGKVIGFSAHDAEGVSSLWFVSAEGGLPVRVEGLTLSDQGGEIAWAPGTDPLVQLPGNRNFAVVRAGGWLDSLVRSGAAISDLPTEPLVANDSVGWMFVPRVSPDGESVAVTWNRFGPTGSEAGAWLISLLDASQRLVLERREESHIPSPIGWTSNGEEIYIRRGEEILRVPKLDGEPVLVSTLPEDAGSCALIPHEEGEFLCVRNESTSDVWIVEDFDPGSHNP